MSNNVIAGEVYTSPTIKGIDAYELAKSHGFEGTEEEWLASLAAHTPEKGIDYWTPEDKEELIDEISKVVETSIDMDFLPTKTATGNPIVITDHESNVIQNLKVTGTAKSTVAVYVYGKDGNLANLVAASNKQVSCTVTDDGGIHVNGPQTIERTTQLVVMPPNTLTGLPSGSYTCKWFDIDKIPKEQSGLECKFFVYSSSGYDYDTGTGVTLTNVRYPNTIQMHISFPQGYVIPEEGFTVYPCLVYGETAPMECLKYTPMQKVTIDTATQTGWEDLMLTDDYVVVRSDLGSESESCNIEIEYRAAVDNVLDDIGLGMSRYYGKNVIYDLPAKTTSNGVTVTPFGNGKYGIEINNANDQLTDFPQINIYNNQNSLPLNILRGNTYKLCTPKNLPNGMNFGIDIYDGVKRISLSSVNWDRVSSTLVIPDYAVGMRIYMSFTKPRLVPTLKDAEGKDIVDDNGNKVYDPDFTKDYEIEVKLISTCTGEAPPPMLTIIDDDGYKGFYNYLLPIVIDKCVPIASAVPVAMIRDDEYLLGANGEYEVYLNDKVSPATWTKKSNPFMNWTQVEECADAGAEILSHTYSNLSLSNEGKSYTTISADGKEIHQNNFRKCAQDLKTHEIAHDYRLAQTQLRRHGLNSEGLVFVGDSSNYGPCIEACKQVYDYGFKASTNVTNQYGSVDRYGIYRWGATPRRFEFNLVNATDEDGNVVYDDEGNVVKKPVPVEVPLLDDNGSEVKDSDGNTIYIYKYLDDLNEKGEIVGYTSEELKTKIDTLKADGSGWMVWMIHTSNGFFDWSSGKVLADVIQYAIDQGIPIVTTDCGVRYYCN